MVERGTQDQNLESKVHTQLLICIQIREQLHSVIPVSFCLKNKILRLLRNRNFPWDESRRRTGYRRVSTNAICILTWASNFRSFPSFLFLQKTLPFSTDFQAIKHYCHCYFCSLCFQYLLHFYLQIISSFQKKKVRLFLLKEKME